MTPPVPSHRHHHPESAVEVSGWLSPSLALGALRRSLSSLGSPGANDSEGHTDDGGSDSDAS